MGSFEFTDKADTAGNKTVYLVDASLFFYRSFHAIPAFTTSDGQPTNAIYGFIATLNKIIKDKNPQYMALAFDSKGPTLRHEIFPDYKANRPPMPEELVQQQSYLRRVGEAFNLASVEIPGFEADDLIASLARTCKDAGFKVVIVAADKDYYQLLDDDISMWDPNPRREKIFTASSIKEKFGLEPKNFLQVQGLMGDATDNFKGVPGVGEKTALKLIKEFGSLDGVYASLDEVKQASLKTKLTENKDGAYLALDLARLRDDADIQLDPDQLKVVEPDTENLKSLYQELEFRRFLTDLENELSGPAISYDDYLLVDTDEKLAALVKELEGVTRLAIDLETTSTDSISAKIVGMSLSAKAGRAFYIPLKHENTDEPQLEFAKVFDIFKPIIESEKIAKVGQNIKYDLTVLARHGFKLKNIGDDSMIASYLIDSGQRAHNLEMISRTYLGHDPISYEQVVGNKKSGFETVAPHDALNYAAEDADLALMLSDTLRPLLEEENLLDLYSDMELPLIEVLAEMEMNGVKLNTGALNDFSKELAILAGASEEKIYSLAGEKFNINSPKQLGEILFEKLKLPQGKKTKKKTGYSTDVEVMTQLAEIHPLPEEILAYRARVKLKSTYVDALPQLINPDTGRLHTSYNQTGTATGRLSSSNPNLQNIPVRTDEGRRMRAAFIPEDGFVILSADYSQIELRVLAHFCGDKALVEAFRSGEDIHRRTASEVFDVFPTLVTPEMRRDAKAINFGIIYGQQAFGLAKELGITRKEAQKYLDQYFERYRGVKSFTEKTILAAKKAGQVTTLYNRRRKLPEINSANHMTRSMAERMAINTRIQGTAADIIKLAMLKVHAAMKDSSIPAKMIMQVHDELVFEVPEDHTAEFSNLVKRNMETVADLDVPLVVDVSHGASWDEAH